MPTGIYKRIKPVWNKGKKCPQLAVSKIGNKNPAWKGGIDKKTYDRLHQKEANVRRRAYREANKGKIRDQERRYKIYGLAKARENERRRRAEDVNYKLRKILRHRVNAALKRNQKSGSAVKDLGCSIPELKSYLEAQFKDGMSWNNWSYEGWHIDHIMPLASFDLTDIVQFRKATHYTNLQPLWAKENIIKSNK